MRPGINIYFGCSSIYLTNNRIVVPRIMDGTNVQSFLFDFSSSMAPNSYQQGKKELHNQCKGPSVIHNVKLSPCSSRPAIYQKDNESELMLQVNISIPSGVPHVQAMQRVRFKLQIAKTPYQIKAYRSGYQTIPTILKINKLSNFSRLLNASARITF